jgi:hypothetical protein
MGSNVHDVDHLPLWLAHLWDAVHDQTKDAASRIERALQFGEALCEYLAVSYIASLIADRGLADERSTRRLTETAARTYAKPTAFGDWAQLVRAGLSAGPALNTLVCGVPKEPRFASDSAIGLAMRALEKPSRDATALSEFLERLVWLRNERVHGRPGVKVTESLALCLGEALGQVLNAVPNVIRRPLCHIEQAAVAKDGFVVHYRHLLGTGQRRQNRHSQPDPPSPSPWRSNQLVLWDGAAPLPTPVPEFLVQFDPSTHELRFCQGTLRGSKSTMVFHSWQPNVQSTESEDAWDVLWKAIKSLEAPRHRGSTAPSADAAERVYSGAFHQALTNDGQISLDERSTLTAVATGLGISASRCAEIESGVVDAWNRAGRPIAAFGADAASLPPPPAAPAAISATDRHQAAEAASTPLPRQIAPQSTASPPPSGPRRPRYLAWAFGVIVVLALVLAGIVLVLRPGRPSASDGAAQSTASLGAACHDVSECEGDLNCQTGICAPFPEGRGGDAARAYKAFATKRNTHDYDAFLASIDSPLTCWFYVHNYDAQTFAKKRFPSEGSTSLHVIHELIIVSESGLRVTLQDRGHIGNNCHDTTILMRNRDGVWKFSGEGSQPKESERGKPRNTDCWEELGGPAVEARFGRYCPPVK